MTSLHHQAHYMEFPHSWYLQANSTDFHLCHMQVYLSGNYIPMVKSSPKHTSPPFSQHILWRCCNHLGILSSTVEILLFNLIFHDRVTPVSISTLKPLLEIIGVLPLKPRASPKLSVCI